MYSIIQPPGRALAGGYNPGAMAREILRPKVALIGRPNIGKSTLFNRLIGYNARRGGRAAIVDELAGVTRDRLYGLCEWDGYEFTIIDCGGIGEESEDPLWLPVAENSRRAMAEAELIIFMTDARTGATISDDAVLKELRRLAKPVIVAVNKVDHEVHEPGAYEFFRLGYSDVMFISALSGRRVGDLLDLVVERLDWSQLSSRRRPPLPRSATRTRSRRRSPPAAGARRARRDGARRCGGAIIPLPGPRPANRASCLMKAGAARRCGWSSSAGRTSARAA